LVAASIVSIEAQCPLSDVLPEDYPQGE